MIPKLINPFQPPSHHKIFMFTETAFIFLQSASAGTFCVESRQTAIAKEKNTVTERFRRVDFFLSTWSAGMQKCPGCLVCMHVYLMQLMQLNYRHGGDLKYHNLIFSWLTVAEFSFPCDFHITQLWNCYSWNHQHWWRRPKESRAIQIPQLPIFSNCDSFPDASACVNTAWMKWCLVNGIHWLLLYLKTKTYRTVNDYFIFNLNNTQANSK